jgi:hypothetical protein
VPCGARRRHPGGGADAPALAGAGALYAAPLVVAALHDCLAAVWVSLVNGAGGKAREVAATLRTRDGLVTGAAALLGGPLAVSTYLLAIDFSAAASLSSLTMTTSLPVPQEPPESPLASAVSVSQWSGATVSGARQCPASSGRARTPHHPWRVDCWHREGFEV